MCVVSKNNEHPQDTGTECPKTMQTHSNVTSTPSAESAGGLQEAWGPEQTSEAEKGCRLFSLSTLTASVGEQLATPEGFLLPLT